MKCFNHPEVDAIGICKNCNKGLCKECITEVDNGIACTRTCIEEVKSMNSLISKNKQAYKMTSGTYNRNAYIYGSFGIVFIAFGFILMDALMPFLVMVGLVFLIGAVFSVIGARKFKKEM